MHGRNVRALIVKGTTVMAIHNEGLPITPEWESGYDAGMQDAADNVINYRPYRQPDSDWQRGYNDAYAAYTASL